MLWKYIRHDNDNTFGNYPYLYNVSTNDIYSWAPPVTDDDDDSGFLYDKIVTVPKFKFLYSVYLQKLFDDFYQFESFSNFRLLADSYRNILSNSVYRDNAHYLDNGFTFTTFQKSVETTFYKPTTSVSPGQIIPSIVSFMQERKLSAQSQIFNYFKSLNITMDV